VNNAAECNQSELELHAVTCCAGDNSDVITRSGRYVDVSPFSNIYDKMKNTTWDGPTNGVSYIIILNEALDLTRKINKSLLNPNQMRG
jgi:hypothetical protein